ncbi:hypothetical protein AO411_2019860 [Salmonella enterica subsp. enterica serovar Sarajane]|nr:hypothetical protein AO411_2019860 [Salmonella enterica subsp. enterica serovar Sarajane]
MIDILPALKGEDSCEARRGGVLVQNRRNEEYFMIRVGIASPIVNMQQAILINLNYVKIQLGAWSRLFSGSGMMQTAKSPK